MHPVLVSTQRFGLYLAAWLVPACVLGYLLQASGRLGWMEALVAAVLLCVFYAFLCLAPWYQCRMLPLATTGVLKLAANHLGAAVIGGLLWIGLASGGAASWRRFDPTLADRLAPSMPLLFGVGVLLYLTAVAMHYVLLAVQASSEAQVQAREAELKALKAQINPHFLFNSLHSISALTSIDPEKARQMCVLLADFLRSTIGLGEREIIPWSEELALVRNYLEVEKIRFGARLQVDFDIDASCEGCQVPPLVLQPLVENAVKHGIADLVAGGVIRLQGRAANGLLSVTIENAFDPEAPPRRRHGLGLRNVRERLKTRYGDAARLTAGADGDRWRVEMLVPCTGRES